MSIRELLNRMVCEDDQRKHSLEKEQEKSIEKLKGLMSTTFYKAACLKQEIAEAIFKDGRLVVDIDDTDGNVQELAHICDFGWSLSGEALERSDFYQSCNGFKEFSKSLEAEGFYIAELGTNFDPNYWKEYGNKQPKVILRFGHLAP